MDATATPRRWSWGLFAFGTTLGLLAVPIATGTAAVRLAALAGVGSLLAGIAISTWRHIRVEHADDPVEARPRLVGATVETLRSATESLPFWAAYLAMQFLVVVAPAREPRDEIAWARLVIAGAAAIALGAAMVSVLVGKLRERGVERELFLQSCAIAFFATMVAAAGYSLFEQLAGAPRLTMWWTWTFGIVMWIGSGAVLRRRAS